jgi:hypothetical protein
MLNRYRRIFLYGMIGVVLVAASFLFWNQALARRPFPTETQITIRTDYELCSHEVNKTVFPSEIAVSNLKQLRSLYPSRDGWRAQIKAKNLVVTRTVAGLCEKCSQITHLGEKGGFVAVIKGPPGVKGDVVQVTKTRVETLPSELRLKISTGTLDLPDEESLLQVLDSLEENYR